MAFSINKGPRLMLLGWSINFLGCQTQDASEETDAESTDPCVDPVQLSIQSPDGLVGDPDLLAKLTVDELDESDENGERSVSTVISAVFADISAYEEELTPAVQFNPACVGILGRPEEVEGIERLSMANVSIRMPLIGARAMELDENGYLLPLIEGEVLSSKGGDTIDVEAQSEGGEGTFPGFEARVVAPPAIKGPETVFEPDGALSISWHHAAEATYFEVVLRSVGEALGDTDSRVRCYLLADDGCYRVPANAMDWLTAQDPDAIQVRLERHSLALVVPEEKALVELDAMRSLEYTIDLM